MPNWEIIILKRKMETMEISPGLEIDFCKKMFSSSLTLFNTYSWLAENFAISLCCSGNKKVMFLGAFFCLRQPLNVNI